MQCRGVGKQTSSREQATVLQESRSRLAESRSMMSTAIARDGALPLAPKAGADLRNARERVGWSLPDLATALRIRMQYLEALEAGRIGDLPGNAYALGFLRTYATSLGLDPNEIARRFKAEAATVNQKTELTFPVPVPERGVPAGAVVLLGALLAVGAYAGWYHLSSDGRLPAETSIQVPMRLAPLAEQAVPSNFPQPAAAAPAPPPAIETAAALPADAPPVPVVSPSSAAAAAVIPPPVVPAPAASPDQSRIVLRASADAWVQVRDRAGPVLLNRILHPGETWPVPPRSNLLLTTGNAGGTDLLVDGVVSPSLGGNGAVRRDLPLDPDLIKDGRLAVGQSVAGVTPTASPRPSPQ
jgi:cytoskeleton protein RodZ